MAREQQGPPADLTRLGDRRSRGRHDLDALLDEVLVATVSTVVDGLPWSVPIFFARDRDRVLLHGSTGGGILRHLAAGAPVTLTVFSLDAIVVAHTAFESSANYRSAVLSGTAESLTGTDAEVALDLLTDRLVPGRVIEVRSSTRREYAATTVLALPIGEEAGSTRPARVKPASRMRRPRRGRGSSRCARLRGCPPRTAGCPMLGPSLRASRSFGAAIGEPGTVRTSPLVPCVTFNSLYDR